MKLLLVTACWIALVGCGPSTPRANQEIIDAVKFCREHGMDVRLIPFAGTSQIGDVQCDPSKPLQSGEIGKRN